MLTYTASKESHRIELKRELTDDLDIVESLGSGIPRVLRAYGEDCFAFTENFIRITFPASVQVDYASGTESGQKNIEWPESVEKIIRAMKENPKITVKELTSLVGLSRRGVEKNIKILQEKGLLCRVGPDKGGHWEVIEE